MEYEALHICLLAMQTHAMGLAMKEGVIDETAQAGIWCDQATQTRPGRLVHGLRRALETSRKVIDTTYIYNGDLTPGHLIGAVQ